jgi:hypothetical protein
MLKRSLLACAAIVVAGGMTMPPVAHAGERDLVGTVTTVAPSSISVTTDHNETIPVALSADTQYLRWLMAKSFGRDIRADVESLRVGQRVYVRASDHDRNTAEKVWIVTGRVGHVD